MAASNEELEVKTSTEGAQSFIDWFYNSVSDRKPLTGFYVNGNAKYAATATTADISINGLVCPTPADFEALLQRQATGLSTAAAAAAAIATASNGASSNGKPLNGASPSSATHRVRYDVDGFDVHVLNPQFRLACPDALLQRVADAAATTTSSYSSSQQQQTRQLQLRMASLLVQVTGHVQYGGVKDAPRSAFNEVFVLVPNWDALAGGGRAPRNIRSHLILSQNFRAL